MNKLITALAILWAFCACQSSNPPATQLTEKDSLFQPYLGQELPGSVPQKFAEGLISETPRYEFGCAMSKDGKEFYFAIDDNGVNRIFWSVWDGNVWGKPELLLSHDSIGYNDPMLNETEDRLYYISNGPLKKGGALKDIDLWYSERTKEGWSDPINVGPPINNDQNQYYSSFSNNGTLYFASHDTTEDAPRYAYDIYSSRFINGTFSTPEKLPNTINTHRYEADVFVAPDESYLIFCSIRRNGMGQGDLYISFKNEKGEWTEAVSMVNEINTPGHELCPYVSPDGKYFFYTSNRDIWWVSTEVFERYR